jgi:ribonuclease P protein component
VPSPKRLTRAADLLMVRREGKRVRTPLLEVRVLASLLHHHRIGIIVPRFKHSAVERPRLKRRVRGLASLLRHHRLGLVVPRHKHTAVDRNRLKRRLRELLRETWPAPMATMSPADVVLYALPNAYAADFASLRSELTALAPRLSKQVPAA